jgi:AcrR family transcriptional regulator
VRDIARAVDIQGASLYAHVASKQEVLWSIVERTASRFEAAADAVEAADPGARCSAGVHLISLVRPTSASSPTTSSGPASSSTSGARSTAAGATTSRGVATPTRRGSATRSATASRPARSSPSTRRDRRLHPVRAQRPRRLVPPGRTAHARTIADATPTSRLRAVQAGSPVMTDPLALEPILGPMDRGRPAFNDDLPHDERYALFEEHVAAGLKIEATDWMPDEYRTAVLRFVEMHANSELMGVLPEREWLMRAPDPAAASSP